MHSDIRRLLPVLITSLFMTSALAAESDSGKKQVGLWEISCGPVVDNKRNCSMAQHLTNTQTKQFVARMEVAFSSADKPPIAVFTAPLGINLQAGVEFQVGQTPVLKLPLKTCLAEGCRTAVLLGAQIVQGIQGGQPMRFTYTGLNGKRYDVPFFNKGFTEALQAIRP